MEEACHWIQRPPDGCWVTAYRKSQCQGAFEQCLRQGGRESRKRCHEVVDMAATSVSAWLPGFIMLAAAAVALLLVPKAMQSACFTREELGTSWFHQIQLQAASNSVPMLTASSCWHTRLCTARWHFGLVEGQSRRETRQEQGTSQQGSIIFFLFPTLSTTMDIPTLPVIIV